MNTLSEYKKNFKKLFYISVKRDLDDWTGCEDFWSPEYKGSILRLNREPEKAKLTLENNSNDTNITICVYRWLFIPVNIKVWWYARKLLKNYKKKEKNKKHENEIEKLKINLNNIESSFLKEIRKKKLENLQ